MVTGIPFFSEVLMPLSFYERPTLVPAFANQKKSEEDFRFYTKKAITILMQVFHKSKVVYGKLLEIGGYLVLHHFGLRMVS